MTRFAIPDGGTRFAIPDGGTRFAISDGGTRFAIPDGGSAVAALYALTHRGNRGDIAHYQRVCRGAQRVLELGAGYGRVLVALARADRRLVGLELDATFLKLARRNLRALGPSQRKLIQLVQGDIRNFETNRLFERVLLPYNTLYCLLAKSAALACFRSARRALERGGLFAFDVWNAAPFARARSSAGSDDREPILSVELAGRQYDVFERSRVRRARQRLDVTYIYVPRAGGRVERTFIPQRYYLAAEIDDLLKRSGFALERRSGDFKGGRFTTHSPQQVVVARAL